MKKLYHVNIKKERAGITILFSDKENFKGKKQY